jgi:hypothetical protein
MASKEYYQKNKDKIKEKSNHYYNQNKEAALARVRKYRDGNRETIRERGREYYRNNVKNRLLNAARARARKYGYEFDLTPEDIFLPRFCPLLGLELFVTESRKGKKHSSFSLDRIDSSRGYTKDNVWVISMKANSMKSDATYEDFKTMANNWKTYHENGYDLSHLEATSRTDNKTV